MDLTTIDKVFGWLLKPAIALFRYLKHRPDIRLSLEPNAAGHSGEGSPTYHFFWHTSLVVHNDSPHLARGIKLENAFPSSWSLQVDLPTRLDPDERLKLPLTLNWHEEQHALVARFGTSSQQRLSTMLEPEILSQFNITFNFENEYGRQFRQAFRWVNGSIQSEFVKNRV